MLLLKLLGLFVLSINQVWMIKAKIYATDYNLNQDGANQEISKAFTGEVEYENSQQKNTIEKKSGDSSDVNPDDRYERGQTVRSLFDKERGCRMQYTLGVKLLNLNKNECLQQCQDSDDCKSVSYYTGSNALDETPVTPVCYLNSESKWDVGPFYQCRTPFSQGWIHYEKIPNYFLIFNKQNGRVLKVDGDRVVLTSTQGDDTLWFWAGENIRSKKDPQLLLTVKNRKKIPGENLAEDVTVRWGISVEVKDEGRSQDWSFAHNRLKPSFGTNLVMGLKSDGTLAVGRGRDINSQYWSLSLLRNYFVLTNRACGNVMQVDEDEASIKMSKYDGKDNQLWFWDDTNLRSRKQPEKVLEIKNGAASLVTYQRGNKHQGWLSEEATDILSNGLTVSNPHILCAENANTGGRVVNCPTTGQKYDQWTFSSARVYFFIMEKQTAKVITANSAATVKFQKYTATPEQLWFWDQDLLRNKKYGDKVLTVSASNNVHLMEFSLTAQQTWSYDGDCLVSKVNEFKLQYNGDNIKVTAASTQIWSMTISHDFFTIWNKHSGQVLDAPSDWTVITWNYHGLDHQRWFWDGRNIRSKQYPTKVVTMSGDDSNDWLDLRMEEYTGAKVQRWRHEGDYFISDRQNRHMSVIEFDRINKKKKRVGACRGCTNVQKEHFSYSAQKPVYFNLYDAEEDNYITLNSAKTGLQVKDSAGNGDWFWEGQNIRSKLNPTIVLTLWSRQPTDEASWWKLTADSYYDPPQADRKQLFWYEKHGEEFYIMAQKDDHPLVFKYSDQNGYNARIGQKTETKRIQMKSPPQEPKPKSCVDETEQKIYRVVEWIPFISTLWDLFSSIGYGIAGCDSVAQERAISMSIGLVTDIGTAVTFGTASGALTALKTGAKVGIKLGMKAGMKATVSVAKTSLKTAFKKVGQLGIRESIKTGLQKSGKFIVKETIIDPAVFLKNIGKATKHLLTKPKQTISQIYHAGKTGLKNLKELRTKLLSKGKNVCQLKRKHITTTSNNSPKTYEQDEEEENQHEMNSTKRVGCFGPPTDELLRSAKADFRNLADGTFVKDGVQTSKRRYGSMIDQTEYDAWKKHGVKPDGLDMSDDLKVLEAYATYRYTLKPDVNKYANGLLNNVDALKKEIKKAGEDKMDETFNQALLMQDWLTKNPIKHAEGQHFTEVYRFEPKNYKDLYKNKEFTTNTMMSTTRTSDIKKAFNNQVTLAERPRVLKIKLINSGSDVAKYSQYPWQREVVVPVDTQFQITSRRTVTIKGVQTTEIEMTELVS